MQGEIASINPEDLRKVWEAFPLMQQQRVGKVGDRVQRRAQHRPAGVLEPLSRRELRLLAHMADIPALKKAFADGLDIHAMTASEISRVAMPAGASCR